MIRVIGRCSECGGRVVVPTIFHSIHPPVPYCESCWATMSSKNLPVVDMEPRQKKWFQDTKRNSPMIKELYKKLISF